MGGHSSSADRPWNWPQIRHSDHGVQYAATKYVARFEQHAIAISMAAVGEPRGNLVPTASWARSRRKESSSPSDRSGG
jgi:transposase InsO family protein